MGCARHIKGRGGRTDGLKVKALGPTGDGTDLLLLPRLEEQLLERLLGPALVHGEVLGGQILLSFDRCQSIVKEEDRSNRPIAQQHTSTHPPTCRCFSSRGS